HVPLLSFFLNPVEECWSRIRSNTKRNPIDKSDTLTFCLPTASQSVIIKYYQGWFKHSKTF
ncbi:hypothetical protein CLU79DRAFT_695433, partial [Phycomyces nitens]